MQNYQKTEILSYFIHAKYFGEPVSSEGESLAVELKRSNIDYYLVWSDGVSVVLPPDEFVEVSKESHPELRIYRSTDMSQIR